MKQIESNHSLEYFNSIPAYAKQIEETNSKGQLTGFYHIKFSCNIDFARAVYTELIRLNPYLKGKVVFYVNKEQTKVIFGGRFITGSRVPDKIFKLLARFKETYGLSKPKKIKELA